MGVFRYTRQSFVREVLFIAIALAFCVPWYILLTLSLKTNTQVYFSPLSLPTKGYFRNYSIAWNQSGLGGSMLNSFIITVASVAGLIVVGSLGGYAIARRESKLASGLYFLFVLGIILPFQLAILPTFFIFRHLHLTGGLLGMILLHIGLTTPLSVFLYTGFVRALPREYEEAAQVDGAGFLRTYLRVVFPLLSPVTGTVAVLSSVVIWNDFFVSLIFLFGSTTQTLPLALYSFVSEDVSQYNLIMAAVAITIVPILAFYIFAQRQLIRGFAGGIRG
ncbi:MAG TPA: carbohydrate ABC transporter permease [Gaiellaceae bacterium]|jgi:raffinose/stachyose/melibiose transport system permease protein